MNSNDWGQLGERERESEREREREREREALQSSIRAAILVATATFSDGNPFGRIARRPVENRHIQE